MAVRFVAVLVLASARRWQRRHGDCGIGAAMVVAARQRQEAWQLVAVAGSAAAATAIARRQHLVVAAR